MPSASTPTLRELCVRSLPKLSAHSSVQAGMLPPPGDAATHWRLDRRFLPTMPDAEAHRRHAGWLEAVRRSRGVA